MKEDFEVLYSKSWFNMIAVMLCAILSAGLPAWGLSVAVGYFIGWVFFAKKGSE